jgi:hypothetical protein
MTPSQRAESVIRIIGFVKNNGVMFVIEDDQRLDILVERDGSFWKQNPAALSANSPNRWIAQGIQPTLADRLKLAISAVKNGHADYVPRPTRPVNKAALAATSGNRVHSSGAAIRSTRHGRYLDSNAVHRERHQ